MQQDLNMHPECTSISKCLLRRTLHVVILKLSLSPIVFCDLYDAQYDLMNTTYKLDLGLFTPTALFPVACNLWKLHPTVRDEDPFLFIDARILY